MDSIQMMEKVAEEAPAIFAFLTSTDVRNTISASPFKDEVLGEMDSIMTKAAAFGLPSMHEMGQHAFTGAKALGGVVAGGVALSLAQDLYSAAKRGLTKTRHYEQMLKHNPDLSSGEIPAKRLHDIFGTLHRMAPELASEPIVAGSYVRQQMRLADPKGVDLGSLTSLIGANKTVAEQKSLPRFGR